MNPKTKTTLFTFLRKGNLNKDSDFYGMDALSLGSESTLEDSEVNFGSSLASDDNASFADDNEDGEIEETKTDARLETERVVRRIETQNIMPRSTSPSASAVEPTDDTELVRSMEGANMFERDPAKINAKRRNSFDPQEVGAQILFSSSHSHRPDERKGQGLSTSSHSRGRRRLVRRTTSYDPDETKMRSLSSSDDFQRQEVRRTKSHDPNEIRMSNLSSSDHFQSRRAENRKPLQRSMPSRSHSSQQPNESSDNKNLSSTKLQLTASDETQVKIRYLSSSDHVQTIRKPLQRSMSSRFHPRQQQRESFENKDLSKVNLAKKVTSDDDDQEGDEMLRFLEEIEQKLTNNKRLKTKKNTIDDNGLISLHITRVERCKMHNSFLQINFDPRIL